MAEKEKDKNASAPSVAKETKPPKSRTKKETKNATTVPDATQQNASEDITKPEEKKIDKPVNKNVIRPLEQQIVVVKYVPGVPIGTISTIQGYNALTNHYKIVFRKRYLWVNADDIETRK